MPKKDVIELQNLVYAFPSAVEPAVKGISFNVLEGEIFGLLGPSGAGKSTTQKVLIGLLKNYEGNVRVLGQEAKKVGPSYYVRIGVGFELPNHYAKLTALENLRFFASFYDKTLDLMGLLKMVGLHEYANRRVEQFSKGMKMRLNFVRALMHQPELIFLDEPTSGLDPVNARLLKQIIVDQRNQGKTIFLTTHNMHDAEELCDRIAFIVDGQLKLIDSPKKLRIERARRRLLVEYLQEGQLHSAEFPLDALGRNKEFLSLLQERELVSLHSQEPSLEDLFVQATGRSLS